jgi:AcrR family transcriptional regulator
MAETRDPIQAMLIAARRTQILDAATTVFAEKGFHRATIKDIARVAGIADGTIYTYFASKTDVLLAILNRLNETTEREQQFAQGSEQDMRSFFLTYVRQRMSLLWPNAEVFRAVLPEMLVNSELRDLYYQQVLAPTLAVGEQFFRAQSQQGEVRKIDMPLTVRAIASTFLGLLMLQLLGDQEVAQRWEELPEVLTTLILDGVYQKKADDEEEYQEKEIHYEHTSKSSNAEIGKISDYFLRAAHSELTHHLRH